MTAPQTVFGHEYAFDTLCACVCVCADLAVCAHANAYLPHNVNVCGQLSVSSDIMQVVSACAYTVTWVYECNASGWSRCVCMCVLVKLLWGQIT